MCITQSHGSLMSILRFGESVACVCQRVNEIFQYSPAAL